MNDLLIENALIVDGTGEPAQRGSLLVHGERIVEVGEVSGRAAQVIDAEGLVLMPGIIDTHTHYDAQITWDPQLRPSSTLGVTTVVMGNCGFTIAPCKDSDREITLRNLTQVEGMSMDVLETGVQWEFETFAEYLDFIERRGLLLNTAAFLGHSSLRTWVMGPAATERTANAAEVEQMAAILSAAMAAGAIGFATSTAPQHNGFGGIPMPSRLASDEEFGRLLQAMGESGRGVFMLTRGSETSIEFLEDLAARSGRPVMIAALLHNPIVPDAVFAVLRKIDAANRRGHELYGQVSPCPLSMEFTLESAYPFEGLDAWKPAMQLSGGDLKALLSDHEFRAAVRLELQRPAAIRLFNGEWQKLKIVEAADPANRGLEGRDIAELANEADKDPLDYTLDLACSEDLRTLFVALLINSDEQAVEQLLTDPNASIALSDAGAHLTFFCDAGFGLHLLGHWQREREVMSLEQAVWHLTGRPATIYRIPERGALRPGNYADLLLFDADTVGRSRARRVGDLPGGGARLTTDALGVHGTWVNGIRVTDERGLLDGVGTPGRLLREFGC